LKKRGARAPRKIQKNGFIDEGRGDNAGRRLLPKKEFIEKWNLSEKVKKKSTSRTRAYIGKK